MEFSKNQPIYLQIADLICENILLHNWNEGERIPSVREFAVSIQVNPNTVMRTYSLLQEEGIITNQRGIGFSVAEKGIESAKEFVKKQVMESELENIFRKISLLEMPFEDVEKKYYEYREKSGGKSNEEN